jgi:hypothetical protein|nr:MAG TPA: large terminase [Caudoviricetes sp.]
MASRTSLSDKQISENKTNSIMNTIAKRASYYRANVNRFVEDYLQIHYLKLFQKILLHAMFTHNIFLFIACRGLGKTYLIALFSVCKCILYPGTKIVVSSYTFKQSKEVIGKITDDFMHHSQLLCSEIKRWSTGQNDAGVWFHNGSYIICKVAAETSRGARANVIIIDESRMVSKNTIDTILSPMLNAPRSPGYLNKPQYSHLKEVGSKYFLTSAWYAQSELYEQLKDYTNSMLKDGSSFFACDLPYQASIQAGLLMKETIENEMMDQSFNEISFMMEYEGKFYGASEDALFSFDVLNKRRNLSDAIYPLEVYREVGIQVPKKQINEVRILSLDVALLASRKHDNDASCFTLSRNIISNDNSITCNFPYISTEEGLVTEELGLLTMRYFYQYDCDYLGLDANGVGQAVLDYLMQDRYDPLYGVTYPALNVINNDDLATRCKVKDAKKCIYAIKANAKSNNDMCLSLRSALQNGYINLLINELDMEDKWSKQIKGYSKLSDNVKSKLRLPYYQTTFLIDELINLDHDISNGLIKVKEKSGMRKDRYSSMEYNYYVVDQIRLNKKQKTYSSSSLVDMLPVKSATRHSYFS